MKVTGEGQRSQKISLTNGHISQTITPTDSILNTKVHYNKRHWMTWAYLTLTLGQGHNSRLKVTDVKVSVFSECFLFVIIFCFIFVFVQEPRRKYVTAVHKYISRFSQTSKSDSWIIQWNNNEFLWFYIKLFLEVMPHLSHLFLLYKTIDTTM